MKKISETLRTYQQENHYTYKETAKKLQMSKSNIYAYINGLRNPTMKSLEKIAAGLNVSVASLLDVDCVCEKERFFLEALRSNPILYRELLEKPEEKLKQIEISFQKKE